jgi:hypothetical protein
LCLSKRRPADFQDIFQSLELDRSVHAQIGTRTLRQWTLQRSIDFERAFASSRIDARNSSLNQAVARVHDHRLPDANVFDLCFRNSQHSFQRCRIGNACDVESRCHLLAFGHQHLLENAAGAGSNFQRFHFLASQCGKRA